MGTLEQVKEAIEKNNRYIERQKSEKEKFAKGIEELINDGYIDSIDSCVKEINRCNERIKTYGTELSVLTWVLDLLESEGE